MNPFKTAYGPKLKSSISFTGKGRTKQSFKAECDVNNILARFRKTGVLDFRAKHEPRYGDVTGLDFTTAMTVITEAKALFAAMPAHMRERFGNKPENFLTFVQDPANRDEARKLGLLKPEEPKAPEPAPTLVRIVQDDQAGAGGPKSPPPASAA